MTLKKLFNFLKIRLLGFGKVGKVAIFGRSKLKPMSENNVDALDLEFKKSIEDLIKAVPPTNYPITTAFSRTIILKLLKFTKDNGNSKVQDSIRNIIAIGLKKAGY